MSSENKSISASVIIEVAGRPSEHLTETLNHLIEKINSEKGTKIVTQKIHEPILIPNQKEFYTSFAEIELSTETLEILNQIVLKYMPSHLEIISVDQISVKPHEINNLFGEIIKKLHTYDETARIIQSKRINLEKELEELKKKLPKEK